MCTIAVSTSQVITLKAENFETDLNLNTIPDQWNKGGNLNAAQLSWSTDQAFDGTHSISINDSSAVLYGQWYSDIYTSPEIQSGSTVDLSFASYKSGLSNINETYVGVVWLDSSNNNLGQGTFFLNNAQNQWVTNATSFVAPTNTSRYYFSVVTNGPATGTLYVDNILMTIPEPKTYLYMGFSMIAFIFLRKNRLKKLS